MISNSRLTCNSCLLLTCFFLSWPALLPQAQAAGNDSPASQHPTDNARNINIQKIILGMKRPEFVLNDVDNRQRSAREWDNKLLIINFWATWCTPCRKEIPMFNRLQAEYGEQGVQFVGIAIDNINSVKQFIKAYPIDYPNLIGGAGAVRLAATYGNVTGTLPFTVLVSRSGTIQSLMSGQLSEKRAREMLDKYLDNSH